MRQADDRGLEDGVVCREHRLHLGGVHVEAAADDHVLLPAHDEEVSIVVNPAEVAGGEDAVREHRACRLLVVEVSRHDVASTHADLAVRTGPPGGARDGHLDAACGAPHRREPRRPRNVVRGLEHGDGPRRFRHAVDLVEGVAELSHRDLELRRGHRRAAVNKRTHARQIVALELGRRHQAREHRGHGEHGRDALLLDERQHEADVEVPDEDVAPARVEHGVEQRPGAVG